MSYTCSIITTNTGSLGESKCLYGVVSRGDSFGRTDSFNNYAWETHSFSDMGITSLRSPAGSNVYVMPYNSNSKNLYITSSTEPFATTYDYISVNVLEHQFENTIGYPINRTIGSAPHYEDDHYFQYKMIGDAIQLANEPPNNHVFLDSGVDPFNPNPAPDDSDLNNDAAFWFLTGSAAVTLNAQGKTNTFYSYETWCNSIVNKSKPFSFRGKVKNINIQSNKANYYEFHTAHSYLYKYKDVSGFASPASKLVQSAVFEQLSSSWASGNMKANGVATTMKFNTDIISLLTSSQDVDLGIDILDVYLFHSESLSYMHDNYNGAPIHFTEWNGNDDNATLPAVTQSLLNTAQMLLSCARLKYESPNLRALTYQLGWSSSPSSLVYYVSNEFRKTTIGYLYEHYKPAFWGKYIHTDMIGSNQLPLGLPNRPRNVMVEAFIP